VSGSKNDFHNGFIKQYSSESSDYIEPRRNDYLAKLSGNYSIIARRERKEEQDSIYNMFINTRQFLLAYEKKAIFP